jgi:hypothetical protein
MWPLGISSDGTPPYPYLHLRPASAFPERTLLQGHALRSLLATRASRWQRAGLDQRSSQWRIYRYLKGFLGVNKKPCGCPLRRWKDHRVQQISTHTTIESHEKDLLLATDFSCAVRGTIFLADRARLNILQRYIAAYARQGLHSSARCSSSR